jgi:hypothetical protein
MKRLKSSFVNDPEITCYYAKIKTLAEENSSTRIRRVVDFDEIDAKIDIKSNYMCK